MTSKSKKLNGVTLRKMGFDLTKYNRSSGYYRVKCSYCDSVVINGVPCHEHGCPNDKKQENY